jgi:Bacterial capsule synthesis protein PGA_cap
MVDVTIPPRVPRLPRSGDIAALAVIAAGCAGCAGCADPAPAPPAVPTVVATRGSGAAEGAAAGAPAPAPAPSCDPTLPKAACARAPVRRCEGPADPRRVGEWRYALIAPLFTAAQDVTRDELLALWRGEGKQPRAIAVTAETAAALAPLLGPGKPAELQPDERPAVDATRWAIVPAHELTPHWLVVSVDGRHPLDASADTALAVPLCAAGPGPIAPASGAPAAGKPGTPAPGTPGAPRPGAVRNIDPARVTTLAMTGTTALTRGTAKMIDRLGLPHATRDVEPWLRAIDLVHISNEVSMVPDCDPDRGSRMSFCSRESYIRILEDSHAKIIELTGSHLTDYGRRWLEHTLDLYRQRGWVWFGGGRNQLEGTRELVVEHHGNRLGFIGCNTVYTGQIITEGPGPAACDLDRMIWQVGDMRRKGLIPIVAIQHEEVYVHDPPGVIVRDFRRLAQAGAAFVFGSQAHTAHPWEVHHGAFLHYGAGNFYFDQEFRHTAEGVADKLYFHDNRLLTVGRLFTKIEDNGRPRPMTDRERASFLTEMAASHKKLRAASPWGTPTLPDERPRPDSFLIGKAQQFLTIIPPERLAADTAAPLVVDLVGNLEEPEAFVVRPRARRAALHPRFVAAATEFMKVKYPIDPERVRVHPPPAKKAKAGGKPSAAPPKRARAPSPQKL